ncbi:MAG: CopG family transcriptional regulator [Muribaculaceae bacterium]|nr:CopG family transcriptional regulator [Muribaculaceae bacterium]
MANHILKVEVSWTGKNFCCSWSDEDAGSVVVTAKTLIQLKHDFEQSLGWHIEGCVEDGDVIPEYLVSGDYEVAYELDTAALLRDAETYTTMAAISRASGINQKQLSHYANGIKQPRPLQRERIIAGLHTIGSQILALC